jgi:hypothetical protein
VVVAEVFAGALKFEIADYLNRAAAGHPEVREAFEPSITGMRISCTPAVLELI